MYAYIKGKLEYKQNDCLIVEAGGIGYRIHTALSTFEALGHAGGDVKIYTHLHVREDIMSLYGFATQEELGMFELLITVTGVGPKAALSIISTVSPSKFGLAVITDDTGVLTKAQGVGGKLAQRIILELKDKIRKEQMTSAGIAGVSAKAEEAAGGSKVGEAISALMVLGYSYQEASRAVSAAHSDDMDLETLVKTALKGLVRK